MAKQSKQSQTLQNRVAELDALLAQNRAEADAAAAALARDASNDKALAALTNLTRERSDLQAQRNALELAQQKAAELAGDDVEAVRAERVAEAYTMVEKCRDALVEALRRHYAHIVAHTPFVVGVQRAVEDYRGSVATLRHVSGVRADMPDTAMPGADQSLLWALYETGIGRSGPCFLQRVAIHPVGTPQDFDAAVNADVSRLIAGVERMLETVMPEAKRTSLAEQYAERENARKANEAAAIEAERKAAKAGDAEQAARREKRVADAALPIARDGAGKVVIAE